MELLLKTRRTGGGSKNVINVGKATISFKGNPADRMFSNNSNNYCSLGLDNNGNLCIFYSHFQKEDFLKVYKPSHTKHYYSISLHGSNKDVVKPYMGSYEISEIKVLSNEANIKQAVLRKIS